MTGITHCSDDLPTTNQVQAITLAELDKNFSDVKFRGLVVAMASWCPPCREELPILSKLYLKYREKGIQVVAVSLDAEGPKAVQPLINKLRVPFPVFWVGPQAAQHYKIVGIPTTMVYSHGKRIENLPGAHPRRTIENRIKSLLTDSQ